MILKAIAAQLNRDPQADALFHDFVVARARAINESIRLGREFVLEDLDKPEELDLAVDSTALLADVEDTDVSDDDTDGEFNFDFSNFDDNGDGVITQDEFDEEAENFRKAFAEIEQLFADDDSDDDSEQTPVKESVSIIREPSGSLRIDMDDPETAVASTDTEDTEDVSVDLPAVEDTAPVEEDTEDTSVDAVATEDEPVAEEDKVLEAVALRKRFLESRRALRTRNAK